MSALMQTLNSHWTSWRLTPWHWTDCICSTTRTWFSPTRPLRTHSAWIDCEPVNAILSETFRCMASLFTIWSVADLILPTTHITACCQTTHGQGLVVVARVWGVWRWKCCIHTGLFPMHNTVHHPLSSCIHVLGFVFFWFYLFGIQLSWLVANVHFLFVLMYFVYSFWFRKHIALILWFTLFLLGLLIHIYFSVYNYFCHIKWIANLRLF